MAMKLNYSRFSTFVVTFLGCLMWTQLCHKYTTNFRKNWDQQTLVGVQPQGKKSQAII